MLSCQFQRERSFADHAPTNGGRSEELGDSLFVDLRKNPASILKVPFVVRSVAAVSVLLPVGADVVHPTEPVREVLAPT